MLTILKGLPISYFKDLQDDKEIVFESYDNNSKTYKRAFRSNESFEIKRWDDIFLS